MKTLISLDCSSESIEKSLVLFYNTIKNNSNFYKSYNVIVFFGDDLPKKNLSTKTVGSVEFYIELSKEINCFSLIDEEVLIKNRQSIIESLLMNGIINYRSSKKLITDDERYLNFIKKVPYKYINPDYITKIKKYFEHKYNVKFIDLFIKKDYEKIIGSMDDSKNIYCIYGLNYDGHIGKYNILYKNNSKYFHLLDSIRNNSVLSCNTAFLIYSIQKRIDKYKDIVIGYREQKRFVRHGQVIALHQILNNYSNIEEPKNVSFNAYYNMFNSCLPYELNYNVQKKAYIDMLNDICI